MEKERLRGDPAGYRFGLDLERLDLREAARLAHALTCPSCASAILLALQEHFGPELLTVRGEDESVTGPAFTRSAMEELARQPWQAWLEDIEGTLSPETLIRLVLRASAEMQLEDPEKSALLGRQACQLALEISTPEKPAIESAVNAAVLVANAVRLAGRPFAWTECFDREEVEGLPSHMQAAYCRALALLRWEQGELDEADELLERSADEAFVAGRIEEEGVNLVLRGLLQLERGAAVEASLFLLSGMTTMDWKRLPWLAHRAAYSMALALAQTQQIDPARRMLACAKRLDAGERSAAEALVLEWLEGRVLSFVGDYTDAAVLLTQVRDSMLREGRWAEATLATVDLQFCLLDGGQPKAMAKSIASELKVRSPASKERKRNVLRILTDWWTTSADGEPLASRRSRAEAELRDSFRNPEGPSLSPIPFAET